MASDHIGDSLFLCCPNLECQGHIGHSNWDVKFCDFSYYTEDTVDDGSDTLVDYYECVWCGETVSFSDYSQCKDFGYSGSEDFVPRSSKYRDLRGTNADEGRDVFTGPPSLIMQLDGHYDSLLYHSFHPDQRLDADHNVPMPGTQMSVAEEEFHKSLDVKCCQLFCPICGNTDPEKFHDDTDENGTVVLRYCIVCCENYVEVEHYDNLVDDLQVKVTECPQCYNQDPNLFVIKEDSTYGTVALCCVKCSEVQNIQEESEEEGILKLVQEQDAAPRSLFHSSTNDDPMLRSLLVSQNSPSSMIMQLDNEEEFNPENEDVPTILFKCQCGNSRLEHFDVYLDPDGIPVDIECPECGKCYPMPPTKKREAGPSSREKVVAIDGVKRNDEKKVCHDRKTKTTLRNILENGSFFLGFTSPEQCRQYFSNYFIRCLFNKTAYKFMDKALYTAGELGMVDPTVILPALGIAASEAVQGTGAQIVAGIGSRAVPFLALKSAVVEVKSVYDDICRARERRQDGVIKKGRFVHLVVRRASQGMGTLAGVATGAVVGHLILPVLGLGALSGLTVGNLIGRGVGRLLGEHAGKAFGMRVDDIKDDREQELEEDKKEEENEKGD